MLLKKISLALISLSVLAGCQDSAETDAELAPTNSALLALMSNPCLVQAAQLTNTPSDEITVFEQFVAAGTPLLQMNVKGVPYYCRREADGSFTVFGDL